MQIHKKKGGGNGSRSSTSPASSLLNGRAYQAIAQAGFPRTVFGADGAGGGLRRRTSDLCRGVPGVSRDSPAPSPPPPRLPAAPHRHFAKPGTPTGTPGLCRCVLPSGSVCLGQVTRAPCCVHGGDDASLGVVLQLVRFLVSKPRGCRDAPFGRLYRAVELASWKGPATIISSNCLRQVCSLCSRNGRCSVLGSGGSWAAFGAWAGVYQVKPQILLFLLCRRFAM